MEVKYVKKRFISVCLSATILLSQLLPLDISAENGDEETSADTTKVTIAKEITGSGTPAADTVFTFTVTDASGAPASGVYTVGGVSADIPASGEISLTAGSTAELTGLAAGEYTITEADPISENYEGTDISVNGTVYENTRTATVTVEELPTAAAGGWVADENGYPVKVADTADENAAGGYYVYTVTDDMIDENGFVTVDFNKLAEYMEGFTRAYYKNDGGVVTPIKIVNATGGSLTYDSYEFTTHNWIKGGDVFTEVDNPTMQTVDNTAIFGRYGASFGEAWKGQLGLINETTDVSPVFSVTGFDGKPVRLITSALRPSNPAILSYFNSNKNKYYSKALTGRGLTGNSGNVTASNITLRHMVKLEELIKKGFSFKNYNNETITVEDDPNRTYADFICIFYGVSSLDELSLAQKINVLGYGINGSPKLNASIYDGDSNITTYFSSINVSAYKYNACVPIKSDIDLSYFLNYGFGGAVSENVWYLRNHRYFNSTDSDTYCSQPFYYLLESDPEIIKMAYELSYDYFMRFTFGSYGNAVYMNREAYTQTEYAEQVSGIKNYLDKTEHANTDALTAFGKEAVTSGNAFTLPHMAYYMHFPDAYDQYRAFDFGFSVTFRAQEGEENPQPAAEINTVFTNRYRELTNVTVKKEWIVNEGDILPDSAYVQLYNGGVPYGEPVALTAGTGWTHTWQSLPADGVWTVDEVNTPDGYTKTVEYKNDCWVITNTAEQTPDEPDTEEPQEPETVEVRVQKLWEYTETVSRPDSAYVQLYNGGVPYGEPVALTAGTGWTHTWQSLPADGVWTVDEVNTPDGYTKTVEYKNDCWVITNTAEQTPDEPDTEEPQEPETVEVRVQKLWEYTETVSRPDSAYVQLYNGGVPYGEPVALTAGTGWTHTWQSLPADGIWTVDEVNTPDGYTKTVEYKNDCWVITNTAVRTPSIPVYPPVYPPVIPPSPVLPVIPAPEPSAPNEDETPDKPDLPEPEEPPFDWDDLPDPDPDPDPDEGDDTPPPDITLPPEEPSTDTPDDTTYDTPEDTPDDMIIIEKNPPTGSSTNAAGYIAAAASALAAAAWLAGRKRK